MMSRVIDECVQLHGGYGYMMEYHRPRLHRQPCTAHLRGTNEIMKELISRTL